MRPGSWLRVWRAPPVSEPALPHVKVSQRAAQTPWVSHGSAEVVQAAPEHPPELGSQSGFRWLQGSSQSSMRRTAIPRPGRHAVPATAEAECSTSWAPPFQAAPGMVDSAKDFQQSIDVYKQSKSR